MRKIWPQAIILAVLQVPTAALSDGVNTGLQDPPVVAATRPSPVTGAPIVIGSNTTGRPGVGPDQVYGYDVNIAYDHVAVGVAIFAGLFLMTEWMEAR